MINFNWTSIQTRLAVLGMAIAIAGTGIFASYKIGEANGRSESAKVIAEYQKKVTQLSQDLKNKSTEVTEKIIVEYVDRYITREKVVYKNLETIVEVVPETFYLSKGWVYSYDGTILGESLEQDKASDATPSSIADNSGLKIIAENNAICLANTEQLIALQQWVRENEKIYSTK